MVPCDSLHGMNIDQLAKEHEEGASIRYLAARENIAVPTMANRLRAAGYTVRSRKDATALANSLREFPNAKGKTLMNTDAARNVRRKKYKMIREYRVQAGCAEIAALEASQRSLIFIITTGAQSTSGSSRAGRYVAAARVGRTCPTPTSKRSF